MKHLLKPTRLASALLIVTLVVAGCQAAKPTLTRAGADAVNEASRDVSSTDTSATITGAQISQISSTDSTIGAAQIDQQADVAVLTIDQLRTYADRCLPNSPLPAPEALDCSELGLRVKRALNTEDKISEALATLDRLGRSDGADEISRSLKEGRIEDSLSAQAIAGGILEGLPTQEPDDPDEKLKELLDESAAIEAGVIALPK
jgi:hypothetical protein